MKELCTQYGPIEFFWLDIAQTDGLFSLDVAPDRAGKIRDIDLKTLHEVGEMIRKQQPR
ncbi:MAG: hypothetical protein WCP45_09015 [Verrucomicrobiota bacterium]